jgi:hypothetical protein
VCDRRRRRVCGRVDVAAAVSSVVSASRVMPMIVAIDASMDVTVVVNPDLNTDVSLSIDVYNGV